MGFLLHGIRVLGEVSAESCSQEFEAKAGSGGKGHGEGFEEQLRGFFPPSPAIHSRQFRMRVSQDGTSLWQDCAVQEVKQGREVAAAAWAGH